MTNTDEETPNPTDTPRTDREADPQAATPPQETAEAFTHDLSTELRVAVARINRKIRLEKADDELSDTQFRTLAFLFREGSCTLGRLSEYEHITPPSMNRTVNKLEAAGYLVRRTAADDRRKVYFDATEAGRELVIETRRRRDSWLEKRLAALPLDKQQLLAEAADLLKEMAAV